MRSTGLGGLPRGSRPHDLRGLTRDLLIAVVVLVVVAAATPRTAAVQDIVRALDAGSYLLICVACLALVGLRRASLLALGVSVGAVSVYVGVGYPFGPVQLTMVAAMVAVAVRTPLRVSGPACGAAVVLSALSLFVRPGVAAAAPALLGAVWISWLVIPWLVGALVRARAAAVRRAGQALVQDAILTERSRLAAEVHDIAGHGFSAVAMQAGVALLVLDESPDQARTCIETIRGTSGQALTELRSMLDRIREPGTPAGAGSAGIAGLPFLAASIRAAGLPVQMRIDPAAQGRDLPPAVSTTGFRVVQEALTNTLRHAGPAATATVEVRIGSDGLVIRVHDNGRGEAAGADAVASVAGASGAADGPGRGLELMRQRVATIGGTVDVHAAEDGGFEVIACLPIEPVETGTPS